MATTYSNFADSLMKFGKKIALEAGRKSSEVLYLEIQKLSPIRSGAYASGHRNLGARIEGDFVIAEVQNAMGYSERVELGFGKNGGIGNRMTSVNWHLRNGLIYHDKGAHTYKKAILKLKPIFNQIIGQS